MGTVIAAVPALDLRSPRPSSARGVRALVLAQTRELAIQVQQALAAFSTPADARVASIVVGVAMRAQLPLVVNYDRPLVATDHIHRVGPTGRAGRPGPTVSLVNPADRDLPPAIQPLLPVPLQEDAGAPLQAGDVIRTPPR